MKGLRLGCLMLAVINAILICAATRYRPMTTVIWGYSFASLVLLLFGCNITLTTPKTILLARNPNPPFDKSSIFLWSVIGGWVGVLIGYFLK